MTTQLDWGDGSGDKITLSYSASEGNQVVSVTSDAHTGYVERSKDIVFRVAVGDTNISQTLTVRQSGKDFVIITRNDTAFTRNDVAVGYEQ